MDVIKIVLGDITKSDCECIVNAANNSLLGGGGVDGAIHHAAGRELYNGCRTLDGCKTGEAKITKGYNLKAHYIIHTVGPVYYGRKEDAELLKNCYINSLNLAKRNNIHSISFPAISTGAYRYPLWEATHIALNSVFEWFNDNQDYEITVEFCCFDEKMYSCYTDTYGTMTKGNGKMKYKISVLGDSISTYKGYNPSGYSVYYKDDKLYDNEIESVNDTWWKQVIDGLGGELCINNSYSGSLVSGRFDTCACSETRCSALHCEASPDIILVYMGTNDRGFDCDIGLGEPENIQKFYGAYRTMLSRLKNNYPTAKIVCATLLMGYLKDGINLSYDRFMIEDSYYNEAIRLAVKEEGCFLADIALSGERYETLDFCHPTKNGHKTIAKLWLEQLRKQ